MEALRWQVFRFTGSEVFNKADDCAEEVLRLFLPVP